MTDFDNWQHSVVRIQSNNSINSFISDSTYKQKKRNNGQRQTGTIKQQTNSGTTWKSQNSIDNAHNIFTISLEQNETQRWSDLIAIEYSNTAQYSNRVRVFVRDRIECAVPGGVRTASGVSGRFQTASGRSFQTVPGGFSMTRESIHQSQSRI